MKKRKKSKKTPSEQLKAADQMVRTLRLALKRVDRELGKWRTKKC